jgi:G3E family GTPase
MNRPVPVFILSGFLGSGKTTLLSRAIRYMQEQGRKPAIVMNELGEVNLDGIAVGVEVPMAEMLDGCICCTVQGDLGITIQQLIRDEAPDIIFIEATGVANPMEILDGVTEASLYMLVEMKGVITVVDAVMLREQQAKASGKTYRLLEEQIRCASVILLNKTDLSDPEELDRLEGHLREWNPHAGIIRTVKAEMDMQILDGLEGKVGASESGSGEAGSGGAATAEKGTREAGTREAGTREAGIREAGTREAGSCGDDHEHAHHHEHHHIDSSSCACGQKDHDEDQPHVHSEACHHEHTEACHHEHGEDCGCHTHEGKAKAAHHSHDHVMVYTRYLTGPVDSTAFEEMVGRLPEEVYRAKGVLTFRDTSNRYLFQYAYRQADFMKITPQIQVPDVVVFIGEQIPKALLEAELELLEGGSMEDNEAAGTLLK